MTALYFFYLENQDKIGDSLCVKNDSTTDNSMFSSGNIFQNEYEMGTKGKKIIFRNAIPFCYNTILKKDIRFHLLHFQGPAKFLIEDYYAGNRFFIRKRLLTEWFSRKLAGVIRLLSKIRKTLILK